MIDNRAGEQAVKGVGTILNELKADGKIEDYDTTGNVAVTGIQFDINGVTLGVGDNSGTLIATFLPENTAGGYYVELKGKKYLVSKVNEKIEIGKTEITTDESSTRVISDVESDDEDIATVEKVGTDGVKITGVAGGTANITVKYSESITTTILVTVKAKRTVTVQSEDSTNKGTVEVSPTSADNKYAEESMITLTATAKTGYQIEGWYNDSTKLSEDNPFDYEVGRSDITTTAKFKTIPKYGKTVNLGTVTANNVEMESGWKYFLEDSNNIYLMYGDYLENAQIPTGTNITISGYNVYTSKSRYYLINYLKGETEAYSTIWSTINEAVKTAVKTRLKANGASEIDATNAVVGITTKGAPTPEQWISSYNENYGTKLGAQSFTSTGQTYYSAGMTSTTSATGYLYTRDTTTEPIKWQMFLSDSDMSQGYPNNSSNMYFPHTSKVSQSSRITDGYCLAGPSASDSSRVCGISYNGYVIYYNNDGANYGVCPVVSIPKSNVVDIKTALEI